jgi:hypothetical protein
LIGEQEFLASRQKLASNLTNVLSGGGNFSLNWRSREFFQIGQLLIHYNLLSSNVYPVFSALEEELIKLNDPGNGLFLMDFPIFAWLIGFKCNLWKGVTSTDLKRT